jgi:hypothetical protein
MPFTSKTKTLVEQEIGGMFVELRELHSDSEEYALILDRITKLHKLKADEQPPRVSPDTLVMVGANLLGIVMILSHERLNIITTKATSLVLKPR